MLTLLPVIYLFASALIVFLLKLLKRGTGFAWLTAVFLTLIAWGGLLWSHGQDLPPRIITPWRTIDPSTADQIIFLWDDVSWGLGFALIALLLCLLLTAPTRLTQKSSPVTWSLNLMITGFGLLGVLAATPLATALAWTALDLTELVLGISLVSGGGRSKQVVIAFSAKVAGTLLLLWAMVQSYASNTALSYSAVQSSSGVFLLLAAGFRLGVLPVNLPISSDLQLQRGISNTLRMTAQASSMVVLARIPAGIFSDTLTNILLLLTGLATFYGAIMWATAKNEPDARQYWSLALAGFTVAAALHGNQSAVITWGVVYIVSGGIISFYSARSKGLIFLPILGLIGMIGLPYTPAASAITGFAASPFHIWDGFFIISLALLAAGYLRISLMPGDSLVDLERWVPGVYLLGLAFLAVSGWLIAALNTPVGLNTGLWWASAASAVLAFPLYWLIKALESTQGEAQVGQSRFAETLNRGLSILSTILRLDWFYRILWGIFTMIQQLLVLITRMLEGQGGVLWAVLLIALFFTILSSGGLLP